MRGAAQLTYNCSWALTVDFLSVFTSKHAKIIQFMLTDVYFILGRECFRERTGSFWHFGRQIWVLRRTNPLQVATLVSCGKTQRRRLRANPRCPLSSHESLEPITLFGAVCVVVRSWTLFFLLCLVLIKKHYHLFIVYNTRFGYMCFSNYTSFYNYLFI